MLDADLAGLYGVMTSRLNEQVRRNPDSFPEDFVFQATNRELAVLMSQMRCLFRSYGNGGWRWRVCAASRKPSSSQKLPTRNPAATSLA